MGRSRVRGEARLNSATRAGTDIDVMMIQCDMCNAWQHGACVGIWGDEEAPDGERACVARDAADCATDTARSCLQNTFATSAGRDCTHPCAASTSCARNEGKSFCPSPLSPRAHVLIGVPRLPPFRLLQRTMVAAHAYRAAAPSLPVGPHQAVTEQALGGHECPGRRRLVHCVERGRRRCGRGPHPRARQAVTPPQAGAQPARLLDQRRESTCARYAWHARGAGGSRGKRCCWRQLSRTRREQEKGVG